MIIIGEKINGTIPNVKQAIETKNEGFIHDLAMKQGQAGAAYIDVCAGTAPELEAETLAWLIDIVQQATDTPIAIDSPNPKAIEAVFNCVKHPGLINSVSLEGDKCDVIFPLIKGTPWQTVALTCDNAGIPKDVQSRVKIAGAIVEKAQAYAITPDKIHIDPLVTALSADNQSLLNFAAAARKVKELYPDIKVTSGLSNISFGMPLRKIMNQNFLALAMFAGMNSAILDPLNRDIIATILAVEALLGQDRHCRNYANAYRQNKIGPVKAAAD
ncbi:5-methyltetrahydrofolate--homocysteine methyltransferase [Desulfitobacterium sp. LBE]|uniref:Pterin-binding domain-containing protein n=5 Tax=root TaxID=1 RepID=Q250B4_DESHY|nr:MULTISPECIES: methyltetrahydrofolate cobalamin methyltransferase [Desulfitobacterium]ACL18607.1 dihydropteroate synthase DHPS [Desulfitobacterium hafniense DCB-2]EHL08162.1 methyltetrahydrofolate:corrinoid/iron-sulfur protein methyltransferase [Desulfitobacterium hafniense DP7]KTE91781.1 methyltetrahydrofolate--corrinoid methyltransferase [Desulfitobacterium hafniense]MEA5024152.1 methyltetrahydrofolate cobalamin methyltransferase [Desulfitobacterium hafniense]TWH58477.1 5-methyltetrahydrof